MELGLKFLLEWLNNEMQETISNKKVPIEQKLSHIAFCSRVAINISQLNYDLYRCYHEKVIERMQRHHPDYIFHCGTHAPKLTICNSRLLNQRRSYDLLFPFLQCKKSISASVQVTPNAVKMVKSLINANSNENNKNTPLYYNAKTCTQCMQEKLWQCEHFQATFNTSKILLSGQKKTKIN